MNCYINKASLAQRIKYLASERRPLVHVDDNSLGVVGLRVIYRYAKILRRSNGSRGGNSEKGGGRMNSRSEHKMDRGRHHPVEAFVRKKLADEFTLNGNTASSSRHPKRQVTTGTASRSIVEYDSDVSESKNSVRCGDRYKRLLIPGSVYHMKKSDDTESHGDCIYWMERQPPEEVRVDICL